MAARNSLRRGLPQSGEAATTTPSSASSISSGRVERPTRSSVRQGESMTKSLTPQSSSDDADNVGRIEAETRQTRLQRRGTGNLDNASDRFEEEEQDDDDADGEVTRCVCGKAEYPGPPVPLNEGGRGHQSRDSVRLASLAAVEGLPEDAGGLFIQCDTCHVWQHGGCVGIMEESATPENYYCEQCRTDMHKILIGARGQRYSRYLPIVQPAASQTPRTGSAPRDGDSRSSKEAEGRPSLGNLSAKRRSTMNSRAAFDEEEMIRKAIEESRGDGSAGSGSNGQRRSKRARDDDSDEIKNEIKRRKTASDSQTPPLEGGDQALADSEDETPGSRSRSGQPNKKSRSVAAQAQRDKELRDREIEKEQERAEAAGRRKGRADRRRADEMEVAEEPAKPNVTSRSAANAKPRPQSSHGKTPTATTTTGTTSSVSHKKKPAPRRAKVGRNQYTKDRETIAETKESPRQSNSRGSEEGSAGQSTGNGTTMLSNGSKPSKPRHMNPSRTSMNDLKKRAAGILEYISRTQIEMAGQAVPSGKSSSGSSTPPIKAKVAGANGSSKLSTQMDGTDETEGREGSGMVDLTLFQELSSLQMMDVLTRELVYWQKDHGKYGEKAS